MELGALAKTIHDQFMIAWNAPIPFILMALLIGFAIWRAMDWRYNGIIERLRADVTYLERELGRPTKAETPKLKSESRKTTTVSASGEAPQEREYLPSGITPDFIDRLRSDLTGAQADKMLVSYEGKWMRVTGTVVRTGFERGETHVSIRVGQSDDPIKQLRDNVSLYFKREFPGLDELKSGDVISASGRIESITRLGINLAEAELI